ncbi:MAG TPA: 50S ribosomal protein L15 [bacterium]|nr:50S ribosomal protein L15 [bacterium]HQG44955.1 50S ribosomal protein L15 [bacterium]HQI47866.1 50S ribosomal protein L15 [bacterium]HQJ66184.1 50S ribosomal protein L15 [bacterium]
MNLANLTYAEGAVKDRKRVGRGGARGKQSGRGSNGARSRSGFKNRAWFEGGQMPIQRRLPKRGFKNPNRVDFQVINVGDLNRLAGSEELTPATLFEMGAISKSGVPLKVLGDGEVTKKITVSANAFSKSAQEKIEAAGGRITKL